MRGSARIEQQSTISKSKCRERSVEDGSAATRPLERLNQSVLSSLEHRLAKDPAADLSALISSYERRYPRQRERCLPLGSEQNADQSGSALHHKSSPSLPPGDKCSLPCPVGDLVIHRPLAPHLVHLLGLKNGDVGLTEALPSGEYGESSETLLRVIAKGELIWHLFGKFIVKIDETTIVKFAFDLSADEAVAMEHVHCHAPEIRIPQPLGVASIDSCIYIFMSFVDGVSLDKLWPSLSGPLKQSVCSQLGEMLQDLRKLPSPWSDGALGSGDPPRCTDRRRFSRTCPVRIMDEEEFNLFLTTNTERNVRPTYLAMVRSQLRTGHRMVMTHGDLRPQNIMVKENGPDCIEVTGLVDWGLSGVYPEYWEYVKALSGMRALSKSDWFDYLPVEAIGRYYQEYMVDIMIDGIQL